MNVSLKLEDMTVNLDKLMLDPNNYRLSYDAIETVYSDSEVVGIQDIIEKKIAKENLDDLMDSILENGFIEVDRIVVRKLKGENDKYLVIEGNRRTASLKILNSEHKAGYIKLPQPLLDKIERLNVVLINSDDMKEIEKYQHTLMGVRHVSGPKKWTGMQSAKLICDLASQSNSASQIGGLLGISGTEANRRMRGYLAYKQLATDSTYGEYIKSKHYTLLLEFLAKSEIREWLKWSDEKTITSSKNRLILYSHIVKRPEKAAEITNPTQAREFCKAISIPKFRKLIENNVPYSQLGPITQSVEEQDREIKSFSTFLATLNGEELTAQNRTRLTTISNSIKGLLKEGE
jgi:hypothetical protein